MDNKHEPVHRHSSPEAKIALFRSLFAGATMFTLVVLRVAGAGSRATRRRVPMSGREACEKPKVKRGVSTPAVSARHR